MIRFVLYLVLFVWWICVISARFSIATHYLVFLWYLVKFDDLGSTTTILYFLSLRKSPPSLLV